MVNKYPEDMIVNLDYAKRAYEAYAAHSPDRVTLHIIEDGEHGFHGVHDGQKRLHLSGGDALPLHINVKELIIAQQIPMIAIQIDERAQVRFEPLRGGAVVTVDAMEPFLDVLVPYPCADVRDQRSLCAKVAEYRGDAEARRVRDFLDTRRIDCLFAKNPETRFDYLLSRRRLLLCVRFWIKAHAVLPFTKKNPYYSILLRYLLYHQRNATSIP
jgi:hypothetical protein